MTDAKRLVLEELDTWNAFMETKGFYDSWARTIAKIEGILARALKERLSTEAATRNAALEESGGRVAAPKWEPIETAPKDGTWVLAVASHIADVTPAVAHWETFPQPLLYAPQSQWRTDEAGDYLDDAAWEEAWRAVRYEPTHWMPLPAPPGALKSGPVRDQPDTPAPLCAEREALAKWFADWTLVDYSKEDYGFADALLSSGIVRRVSTREELGI